MSLKNRILKELSDRPQSLSDLRARFRKERGIADELAGLVSEGLVKKDGILYSCSVAGSAGKKAAGAVRCRIVKLAGTFGFAAPVGPDGEVLSLPDGSRAKDYFIPGRYLCGAMPGDIVLVRPLQDGRSDDDGEIVGIEKQNDDFVGTIDRQAGWLVLLPDACPAVPILISRGMESGAAAGEKAAVHILTRGRDASGHRAAVVARFGSSQSAGACTEAIFFRSGIETEFRAAAKKQAARLAGAVLTPEELAGRLDLRGKTIFTIDGPDTKDIDDAISLERTPGGFELGVHIADVSRYVPEGSALDETAYARGTSVYTPGRVVPMLPKELSNGVCSLNPGEDRLCFSCLMQIAEDGRLLSYRFAKAVMRSQVQGVYGEINAIFGGTADDRIREKYADCLESLGLMHGLYRKFAEISRQRGSMDIESSESVILLNERGVAVDIRRAEHGEAEQMIEEFMLHANTCAARFARENGLPFLYRVHAKPTPEKAEALSALLAAVGVSAQFASPIPSQTELSAILDSVRGTRLERLVHTAILRSMSKAVYSDEPKGHYGLALSDYSHFTSPIRRYPDLQIHRIMTAFLAGMPKEALTAHYGAVVSPAAVHLSGREVAAMTAERDADDCYKAEYMACRIGEVCDAVVSSVTSFGIYVELDNTVEGLIHISRLSRGEMTQDGNFALADKATGKRYQVGDPIRVRLLSVSVAAGTIDFDPVR